MLVFCEFDMWLTEVKEGYRGQLVTWISNPDVNL